MENHLIADIPVKALIVKDGKILITKDRRWELPGGRINIGEDPEETLHREVKEELGVDVKIRSLQDVFIRPETNPAHLLIIYHCELLSDEPFQVDIKEVQDMRWISNNDDLSSIDFYPGYQELFTKYFQTTG
jgi:mutator protein MutT